MQVINLSYKHHKEAPYFFQNLSFDLEPGKIHALHGKNGVGKSVLLQLLARKIPPQAIFSGEIGGAEKSTLVNQRFDQMIADQFSFHENLQFACMNMFPKLFGGFNEPKFFPDFLDRFDIDYGKAAHKLSGGQRQILALMMVLQKPQSFLLLDEPTATLDDENAHMVFEFLQTLTLKNITFLIVCHDRELMNRYTTGKALFLESDSGGARIIRHLTYPDLFSLRLCPGQAPFLN